MFTGIVEETGEVTFVEDGPEGRRLGVTASFCADLEHGQSISVSGACLTVEDVQTDEDGGAFGNAAITAEVRYSLLTEHYLSNGPRIQILSDRKFA